MNSQDKELLNGLLAPLIRHWGKETVIRAVEDFEVVFDLAPAMNQHSAQVDTQDRPLTHAEFGKHLAKLAGEADRKE